MFVCRRFFLLAAFDSMCLRRSVGLFNWYTGVYTGLAIDASFAICSACVLSRIGVNARLLPGSENSHEIILIATQFICDEAAYITVCRFRLMFWAQ